MAMRYSRGTVFLGCHSALVVSDCKQILVVSLIAKPLLVSTNSLIVQECFRIPSCV